MGKLSRPKVMHIFDSLGDVSVTVVADLLGDFASGGVAISLRLAEAGVTAFPVGVVGEDELGQRILRALQQHKISTSGISRLKNYATPASADGELIHGEHPALLSLVDHARKFTSASDAIFVCDHGVGAASPRVLNFIKSDGSMRDKPLVARSRNRVADFEQLTAAVATEDEIEKTVGASIAGDPEKLEIAGEGVLNEMRLLSFVALTGDAAVLLRPQRKAERFNVGPAPLSVDVLGGLIAAGLAAGEDGSEATEFACLLHALLLRNPPPGQRRIREELRSLVASTKPRVATR